jgi:hypothetical protein
MAEVTRGRWALGAALALSWLGVSFEVLSVHGLPYAHGAAALLEWLVAPAPWVVLSLVFFGALAAFLLRRWQGVAAVVATLLLALALHLQVSQWPGESGVRHAPLMPAAALGAYGLAWLFTKRERTAHEAACGVVAAIYFLAGVAKLEVGGLHWAQGGQLALLIAERSVDVPAWLAALRRGFALSPGLCSALAATAVAVECAGLLFVWPRARSAYAVAAIALHAGIAVLMGYVYVHYVLTVAALAFSRLDRNESSPSA